MEGTCQAWQNERGTCCRLSHIHDHKAVTDHMAVSISDDPQRCTMRRRSCYSQTLSQRAVGDTQPYQEEQDP